ncbi:MAG: flippase-like domain-containing protein [Candidatus Omnitrophica bacterium]|nr:flippase-like domain-containing protein [Candidatus Omnitrophota bacterium]
MISKKYFSEFLRILVSLFFVSIAVYFLRDKWHHSFTILKQINRYLFSSACALFVLINLIVSYRFSKVLRIQSIHPPFRRILYLNFVGLFFNLFLPSALGGDVVKAYYLSKDSGNKMRTISSVLVDRLLGLGAVISVAMIALPFFIKHYSDLRLVVLVLLVAMGFGVFVLFFSNEALARKFKFLFYLIPAKIVKQKISEFYYLLAYYRHHPVVLGYCLGVSLIVQWLAILMSFLVAQSIGVNISFMVLLVILPITTIISMLPSLGGLGVREASVIYFLSSYVSVSEATAFALALDILIYGFGLFCGILYLLFHSLMEIKEIKNNDR